MKRLTRGAGPLSPAEPEFRAAIVGLFSLAVVGPGELHPDYQAEDVSVWRLTRAAGGGGPPKGRSPGVLDGECGRGEGG